MSPRGWINGILLSLPLWAIIAGGAWYVWPSLPAENCAVPGGWHGSTMRLIEPGSPGQVMASDLTCDSGFRWRNVRYWHP
jgi:hypothetical protein